METTKRPAGWTDTEYRALLAVLRDEARNLPEHIALRLAAIAAGKAAK